MPTKTTNPKTSAKKHDDAKTAKPSAAPKTTAKPAPASKDKGAPDDAPAAPKIPQEVVSLIEPKAKRIRTAASANLENKPFSTLPSISRLLDPEPPKPVAVSAPAEVPATPSPVGTEAEAEPSNEKLVHLKPPFTVKDLGVAMGIKPFQVIHDLMAYTDNVAGVRTAPPCCSIRKATATRRLAPVTGRPPTRRAR